MAFTKALYLFGLISREFGDLRICFFRLRSRLALSIEGSTDLIEREFEVLGFRFFSCDAGVFFRNQPAHLLNLGVEDHPGFFEAGYFLGSFSREFAILRLFCSHLCCCIALIGDITIFRFFLLGRDESIHPRHLGLENSPDFFEAFYLFGPVSCELEVLFAQFVDERLCFAIALEACLDSAEGDFEFSGFRFFLLETGVFLGDELVHLFGLGFEAFYLLGSLGG